MTGSMGGIIGPWNPFRYRGYFYDSESGLYYLNSRYYDPETGRWISADVLIEDYFKPVCCNICVYCRNNPIRFRDDGGYETEECWDSDGSDDLHLPGTDDVGGGGSSAGANSSSFGSGLINGSASAPSSSAACFIAGTLVNEAGGLKPIEDVCVNDFVWAWNEHTGEAELKRVTKTYVNQTNEWLHVFVKDEEIICTPEHPFYSPVKGWTAACKLRAGDILVTLNGEYVVLEKIQHELLESFVTVYNFQVADNHSYYVSSESVLIHNCCSQRAAMRAAKRSENIPLSQAPDYVGYEKWLALTVKLILQNLKCMETNTLETISAVIFFVMVRRLDLVSMPEFMIHFEEIYQIECFFY